MQLGQQVLTGLRYPIRTGAAQAVGQAGPDQSVHTQAGAVSASTTKDQLSFNT